jgi:hypothetical protein
VDENDVLKALAKAEVALPPEVAAALAPADDQPAREVVDVVATKAEGRECGSCRACCTVLGVQELGKDPHTRCSSLSDSTGCTIYETRPGTCAAYVCGWLGGSFGDGNARSLRPDRLGVILDRPAHRGGEIVAREVWRGAFDRWQVRRLLTDVHKSGFKTQLVPFAGRKLPVGKPLL